MKKETAKSFILSALVLIGAVLTWNLWTYHPNYELMQNPSYIQDVSISDKKTLDEVLQPRMMLLHKNDRHYGTSNVSKMDSFVKDFRKWEFDDFVDRGDQVSVSEYTSFLHGDGIIEIVYPNDIPAKIFKKIFSIKDNKLSNMYFDRIVLHVQKGERLRVFFVNYDDRTIYEAMVAHGPDDAVNEFYAEGDKTYDEYIPYSINNTKTLFVHKEEIKMNRMQYYIDILDAEMFKDALFSDPSFVKKDEMSYREEYTDGTRLIDVNLLNHTLVYVNPAGGEEYQGGRDEVIDKGVAYVNDHGGWTDTYLFSSWSRINQQVTFRMFVNSYPIFNDYGLSTIEQFWRNSSVYRYERPLMTLAFSDSVSLPVTMPSGKEVLKELEESELFEVNLLEDLVLGYDLLKDSTQNQVVMLEPAWFYRYGGIWKKWSEPDLKEGDS